MNNYPYILAAIALGVTISLQPPINATMARVLGSPLLSATVSISISLIIVSVLWLTRGKGAGDISQITSLPWWVVIGGVVGAAFVVGAIIAAPALGVAVFFVCVVSGQLIGSTIIDQVGAFGLEIKPINTMKLVGLGLVLFGAWIVQNSNA